MGNDRRETHEELNGTLHDQPRPVHDLLQQVCRLDGVEQNENGKCPVCGRVLSAPRSAPDASDDQVETTPTAQFYERVERQRREREREAASRATKTEPEISAQRDWRKFLDSAGYVRW